MFPIQPRRKILLSLLCLLSLTALTACMPKSNRFGIILISNNVVGPTDIYRIPDNTQNKIEQLTFTPTIGEYYLLVSKNGDRIIFQVDPTKLTEISSDLAIEGGYDHIYLLDTASKKLKDMSNIFTVPPVTSPMRVVDWSPDGKQFAVITDDGGLEFIDFDGTNKKNINIPSLGKTHPLIDDAKWSPDRKKLAVRQSDSSNPQDTGGALLVYDLGNGKLIQLSSEQENCGISAWSPTSQQIAAVCDVPSEGLGPAVLRILNAENPGQPYEHLLLSPCNDPSWSPDGKHLAFDCKKSTGQWGIFIINSDGNGIHELKPEDLENSTSIGEPIWSPDGTQIVYMALTDDEYSKIYSVNSDGSNNRALTNQDTFYSIVSVYPVP